MYYVIVTDYGTGYGTGYETYPLLQYEQKNMTITIEQIAELAGVSKTTVSRVINNKPDVNKKTRARILELMQVHDFQPNVFAKAISLQKSHNVGLIIPHEVDYVFANQFYVEVMRGVSTTVESDGYHLMLCYLHSGNFVDLYKQKRVDGFIVMSPGEPHQNIIESLKVAHAPFVSTARISAEEVSPYVDVNNFKGAQMAMEHLIALGHHRIAFVGKPTLRSSLDRLRGYRETLDRHNIQVREAWTKISRSASFAGGYQTMLELLDEGEYPTAVFITNDIMSIGAIKAIQERGLKVPDDISLVGFDDVPLAQYSTPPLTTIRQPAYEKGIAATKLLIRYIETEEMPQSTILDIELIVRESTAPPRE